MRALLGLDIYYFILVVPTFLLSLWAQSLVKNTFNKYSRVYNVRNLTGADVARKILDDNGLYDVQVLRVDGHLSDHYDPKSKVVRLSDSVYSSTSLSAIGVAAHETGHAIQDKLEYFPLVFRSLLYPFASIGTSFGPTMAIFGLIFSFSFLTKLGIVLFGVAVLFYIVTLPVEIDASMRAVSILNSDSVVSNEELVPIKKVLSAAAMTYVAAAASAMANLIRLILLARDRNS